MDMDLYRLFASFTAFLLQKMTNNGEVWYDIKQKSCVFSGVKKCPAASARIFPVPGLRAGQNPVFQGTPGLLLRRRSGAGEKDPGADQNRTDCGPNPASVGARPFPSRTVHAAAVSSISTRPKPEKGDTSMSRRLASFISAVMLFGVMGGIGLPSSAAEEVQAVRGCSLLHKRLTRSASRKTMLL